MCRDLRQYAVWAKTRAFARKLDGARAILRDGLSRGPIVVSVSWGKDSIAMADLALDTLGQVPLLHLSSPYALPGYDDTRSYFDARTKVHVLEATRSLEEYVEWCKQIGLPHERERSVQQRVVAQIKRDRGAQWCDENGYTVLALGMRIHEGGPRAKLLRGRGPVYELKSGQVRCCPLAYWTSQDVWAYIASRRLPYNHKLYDAETHGMTRETIRNTGWLSTDGAHDGRIAWLRQHFPDQYDLLVRHFPHVTLYS